jgi:chloramphenicol 3-O phosphotransferase
VIDELLLTPDLLPRWMDPIGLARGHYRMVHDHGTAYDMTVDTTTGTPTELAKAILRRQ